MLKTGSALPCWVARAKLVGIARTSSNVTTNDEQATACPKNSYSRKSTGDGTQGDGGWTKVPMSRARNPGPSMCKLSPTLPMKSASVHPSIPMPLPIRLSPDPSKDNARFSKQAWSLQSVSSGNRRQSCNQSKQGLAASYG